MIYRMLADIIVALHLLFIVFAVLGGLLLFWRRFLIYFHLPAALWAALISFQGWICPLTPLENYYRIKAGVAGYEGSFIEYYLLPIIYPAGLTPEIQTTLGMFVVLLNFTVYFLLWKKKSFS